MGHEHTFKNTGLENMKIQIPGFIKAFFYLVMSVQLVGIYHNHE